MVAEKLYKSQFHEGSSTSLCGFLLFLLDCLGGGIFGGDMDSGDTGGIGSVSECWLTQGFICGRFGIGTRWRKNW